MATMSELKERSGMVRKHSVGRPMDPQREALAREYGISVRHITAALLDQLDRCKSPEAQRLILGVTAFTDAQSEN